MGTSYQFLCPCGYGAIVSGGLDYGFVAVVRTMVCLDCRKVVDVLVGAYGEEGKTGAPEYDRDIGRCPECGGTNIRSWPREKPASARQAPDVLRTRAGTATRNLPAVWRGPPLPWLGF